MEKASERRKILEAFYHAPKEPSLRINRANIENEEDVPYFLRGAYLVCGSLTDPHKEYHLEFGVSYMNLSRDLSTLIGEVLPQPKSTIRRGSYIVYYIESENIEVTITYIGAMMSSLEMMNIKIEKDIKKYGLFKGLLKAIFRILRCNPFSKGGIDYPLEVEF